jgi:hypothetical protein
MIINILMPIVQASCRAMPYVNLWKFCRNIEKSLPLKFKGIGEFYRDITLVIKW